MCGRYTLLAEEAEILQKFGIDRPIDAYEPSYNIAPGQNVLVVIHDGREKRAGYVRWGLVPSWAKDEKIGYKMINARSETAHEKPSFKNLMVRKRCLIIADSFYEWQKTGQEKQPKRIQLANHRLFAFAGLWDRWQRDEKELFTCTILTKDSNHFMKEIHHRMPIILPKDKEDAWIHPQNRQPFEANQFLQALETDELTAYSVSNYVNAAKNNSQACIEPLL
ncbi:SOS response-associated peptidase [Virgibacillus alimentarius]|uniref:Abasic site processing protein n=1 Tax=Virgibacillus alimentarius TaxID=698769 RepID=A0ABS4SC96_9BACI|nr:SOS response-associated peptidase [Virgibacillus alimentarius]MBP2258514.1 putative SOS response-associated peptidase YedK [Virgibacillus alimentarius]